MWAQEGRRKIAVRLPQSRRMVEACLMRDWRTVAARTMYVWRKFDSYLTQGRRMVTARYSYHKYSLDITRYTETHFPAYTHFLKEIL